MAPGLAGASNSAFSLEERLLGVGYPVLCAPNWALGWEHLSAAMCQRLRMKPSRRIGEAERWDSALGLRQGQACGEESLPLIEREHVNQLKSAPYGGQCSR